MIDPKFLSKGLKMAKQKKYTSIRITPPDFREDKLEFNIEELARCKGDSLPKNIGAISATEVRISAGRKLKNIDALFGIAGLKKLMLQDLFALADSKNINKLKSLTE